MGPKRKKKGSECVELQDRGALAIYEITKNMTREEELAYWAKREAELRRLQRTLPREASTSTTES